MAPSIDCVTSLFCAEDAIGSAWGDDEETSCADEEVSVARELHPAALLDFPVDDDEAIAVLVDKETRLLPDDNYLERSHSTGLTAGARESAVFWMLKVQAYYSFGPLTVALAVNYLDRFLSRNTLPAGKDWMLQLLSVACISLAAKVEETEVPILLDLQVEDSELLFEARSIQRMELLVLSTLEWRMLPVTPFSYVDYFLHKLGVSSVLYRSLLSRISELVLASLKDERFLGWRPSAVSAAAILCAVETLPSAQAASCKHLLHACLPVGRDIVDRCYRLMQERFLNPSSLASKRKFSVSPSVPHSPVGVLEAASMISCASESTIRSLESSPSVNLASATVVKKRKLDSFGSGVQHSLQAQ